MKPPIPSLPLLTWIGIAACAAFGNAVLPQPAAATQRPPLYAASSTQSLRLLATFVHPQAERSLAVLQQAGAASQTLHIGQDIGNGLRVHSIARDHIVLARGSQLSSLRLLGQGAARKQPARAAATATPAIRAGNANTSATSNGGALLRADNIDAVRAACSDSATMAALPDAQKAELSALGLCNTP